MLNPVHVHGRVEDEQLLQHLTQSSVRSSSLNRSALSFFPLVRNCGTLFPRWVSLCAYHLL